MHLFYTPFITETDNFLPEEESAHCIRVMRMKKGDLITSTDGKGHFYKTEITEPDPKKCRILLKESQSVTPPDFNIHIAIAPTKNMERIEWFVEKAVELGVQQLSFLQCEHSERQVLKLERIEKIAISAMKQSQKAFLPCIYPLTPFKEFVAATIEGQKFVAHLEEGEKKHLKAVANPKGNYTVLIGPEGDFSVPEIASAIKNGFIPVTLGESRLRTETAGLAACMILNFIND